ncbi:MAG TPA: hypothetical protein VFN31_00515 [Candidatus Saccharimonadales bacterium]|nr:hypothetical protein [Candidatus Saccharimonadales bacterium]
MEEATSKRRLAENEAVFRQLNEQVDIGVIETNRLADEDNQPEFKIEPQDENKPIYFFCECADENCTERVLMNLKDYREIHENRNNFVILPGHQVKRVEKIILKTPDYYVVQKNIDVPENPQTLNSTDVDNS